MTVETLDGALARWDGLLTADEHYELLAAMDEHRAEMLTEGAWLRHAESLGWEEAMLDSYVESGLMLRY